VVRAANNAGWMVFEPKHSELDVRDEAAVRKALAFARPDVIVHTAYRQNGPDAWATNVDGSAAIARVAVASGARLIHISTDLVFSGRTTPYDEGADLSPLQAYGRSKAAAERSVSLIDPKAAIVRTSLLYDVEHISPANRSILDAAAGRIQFSFFEDEIRCFTPVQDLASAIMDLCYHDYAGPLNIAGPEPLTRYDFACRYARQHGQDPSKLVKAYQSEAQQEERPGTLVLDSSRSAGLLTTRIRPVSEILRGGRAA
jgi:dTDP-4-dehydrorhamnose reductase